MTSCSLPEASRICSCTAGMLVGFALVLASCDPASSKAPPRRTASQLITTQPGAESAEYVYDGAGNLLAVREAPSTSVAVADFFPATGGFGQVVTVSGSGFSPTPGLNVVHLGAASAAVLWATANTLAFEVPIGAVSGKVTVAVDGTSATSATDFTVVSGVAVVAFAPKIGAPGTILAISGHNFDPSPANDTVSIGAGSMSVTSATATSVLTTVDESSSSGKVAVTTPAGTGVSFEDFFVLPAAYEAWDIGFTGRLSTGDGIAFAATEAGQSGLILFDGVMGQGYSLYITGLALQGDTLITVYAPDKSTLLAAKVTSGLDSKLTLPTLSATGTYMVVVQPEPYAVGDLRLQLFEDVAMPLPQGVATAITLAHGQNGRYSFTGAAGDSMGLACSALSMSPSGSTALLRVLKPDGSSLWSTTIFTPTSSQLPQLPTAGTYTLQVQPGDTAAGALTFLLSQPSVGAIAVDGPAVQFQGLPGQSGRYVFAANAGDELGLGLPEISTMPAGGTVNVYVYKPDGTALWNAGMVGPRSFQLPKLPATGTYTLAIQPASGASASATALLSKALGGTLAADGNTTTFEANRVGQAGRYTFDGLAGQRLTMQATLGGGFPIYGATLTVYLPSGAPLVWTQFGSSLDVKLDLGALPASGTYSVTLVPSNLNTGTCAMRLISYATDALAVDGAPKILSLGAAQNGRYSFAANVGDHVGLGLTAISTSPSGTGVSFTIYRPDGVLLRSSTVNAPTNIQLPVLPVTGTYRMFVVPTGAAAATAEVLLSRAISGALVADGSTTTFESGRVGQSGRYQFDGVTGQRLTMQATAGGGFPIYGAMFTIYLPSGAPHVWTQFSQGLDVKLDLGALPATGTYCAVVEPYKVNTGSVSMRLMNWASGTITIGSPAKAIALLSAQNGRYTFVGSSGALLNLSVANLATKPPNASLSLSVTKPDGSSFWSSTTSMPRVFQWPTLPATGTYGLTVSVAGTASASAELQLYPQ